METWSRVYTSVVRYCLFGAVQVRPGFRRDGFDIGDLLRPLSFRSWYYFCPCEDISPNCTPRPKLPRIRQGLFFSCILWGENVGWINFNPKVPGDSNHYGVTIDHEGNFDGWAWGENIGWIHFRSRIPPLYKVQTSWFTSCEVGFDDLGRFVQYWLDVLVTENGLAGDLDGSGEVDFYDYARLADLWLGPCPPGWPLKE